MTPPKKFKVALIQFKPKPLDPDHNFNHASTQIRSAATQGAHLAILPEYHLSAWDPTSPQFIPIAQSAAAYQVKYQDLAKELGICICTGTIVQTPANDTGEPTLLNVSAFIDERGTVLDTYIKTNVWIPERDHLTSSVDYAKDLQRAGVAHSEPGDESPHRVIETSLGKIGILVCWDLAFPEAFRSLVLQGADVILVPTYWTKFDMKEEGLALNADAEKLFLESTLVARAFENTCMVVFCNAGGPADEGFLGLSGVYAPILGRVKGSFEDGTEGMRIVEIDRTVQEIAEGNYRVREDLNKESWHYGYAKMG